ncbi:MAG: glucose 1-dehydrogenase [Gammaproteobacteria bacterium]|jgi:3-oxoacyl-[acyl-carrier protein] reductase|nr:glucose 1-dehydrogenase [Pseudomonadota bacterium]MDG2302836.1 glucose 1-dehydrogenase [Gammaproteobacteria bacterium]MBT5065617.1 glucose 1-dehydrogenase [Pseudomonadota bacterium]MBT6192991.1 glucose 1-dehydrogenase [Pseudomonadota bacterium]MBT6464899.1 glucose 1-dehydrogenase [Pseudomonadota bacterium]
MVLKHQTAIVTGGSRGIGKAIALHLSTQGFNIVLSFKKDEKAAAQVVSDIQKSGGAAEMIRADLSLADSANDITRTTIERFGRIDVLINNAGVSSNKSLIADTPDLEWNEIIEVNLHGVFRMMKAVVPHMRQQKKGNIVNISSNITKRLAPTFGTYAISKAALETMTQIVAKEEAANGIRVNAVAPGPIKTDMLEKLLKEMGAKRAKSFVDSMPMKRMGTADEIANMVAMLTSDVASFVTGQIIYVNGGGPGT